MGETSLSERSGSQTSKLLKKEQRTELTPEQIQQQNILRLNGFSTSTILRNTSSVDVNGLNSPKGVNGSSANLHDISTPPGLFPNNNLKGLDKEILGGSDDNSGINGSLEQIDEDNSPPMDRFGLKGLTFLLGQNDNEKVNIAKGLDMNMLGLNLSMDAQSKVLSKTLPSPWLETSRSEVEPLFVLPQSFRVPANELLPIEERISSLNDLTLFFIFYTKPRDILQELSARELNKRNWRYHKELQVWLTKDTSSEPKPINIGAEEGTYIFFDPVSWEFVTKSLVLYYNSII